MAVLIYKDGVCSQVEPEALRRHLDIGWSVKDPGLSKPVPPATFYPASFNQDMPQEQAETAILEMMNIVQPAAQQITQTDVIITPIVSDRPPAVILSGQEICDKNKIKVVNPVSTLPVVKPQAKPQAKQHKKRGTYKKKSG